MVKKNKKKLKKSVDINMRWWYYTKCRWQTQQDRLENRIWRGIEVVITRRSWKPFVRKGAWVRIPPSPLELFSNVGENWIRFRKQLFGEVPKWLKGHPWKGCRSLIAARGFKSLLLRSLDSLQRALRDDWKRFWKKSKKVVDKWF